MPPEVVVFVGTIGDLHCWIQKDESDFDFLIRTILFGALSACVAVFPALPDRKTGSDTSPHTWPLMGPLKSVIPRVWNQILSIEKKSPLRTPMLKIRKSKNAHP